MRKLFLLVLSFWAVLTLNAQSINDPFFDKVSYAGAFSPVSDWTADWTEWDPVNKVYPEATVTKGNGVFTFDGGIKITSNETWNGTIRLDGWVYVENGATLSIEAGTVIRGTAKSALIITRGAKINATGTKSSPIVFTSNQGEGFRAQSDWGGIVVCGNGIVNTAGGEKQTEGGVGVFYGGTDNADNSGVMKYVRIEFPGFEVATGSELNGLSLCAVGSGTTIENIQVSYSGDDGFEWWGGAVNAKYLISYKTEDDDFDTDNGYVGMVQFGVILRDASIVDTDTANGFESDNDDAGNDVAPYTNAIFSNISAFGPSITNTNPETLVKNHNEGSAMRIRRASRLQIYNSVFAGFGRGFRIESSLGWTAAQTDLLTVKHTILAGIRNELYKTDVTDVTSDNVRDWFLASSRQNRVFTTAAELNLVNPFNFAGPDFKPTTSSPVLNSSYWFNTAVEPQQVNKNAAGVIAYPNPFSQKSTISIDLKERAMVDVKVYDLNGRLVRDLYHEWMEAGNQTVEFHAGDLPQGIYIGRIMVGIESYTLKLVAK